MKPTVAIGAVVVGADRRVLLVRRAHAPLAGEWTILGGRPREGETLEAATMREVREETGLDVDVLGLVEIVVLAREGFAYEIHEYVCTPRDAAAAPRAGDDALDVVWAGEDELARYGVRAEARTVVAHALAMLARVSAV